MDIPLWSALPAAIGAIALVVAVFFGISALLPPGLRFTLPYDADESDPYLEVEITNAGGAAWASEVGVWAATHFYRFDGPIAPAQQSATVRMDRWGNAVFEAADRPFLLWAATKGRWHVWRDAVTGRRFLRRGRWLRRKVALSVGKSGQAGRKDPTFPEDWIQQLTG